jgi:putative PIN family toxin of toxin-antitoxin system
MRIVIDTNIWVSGLLWRGAPGRVLRLAERGEVELCVAPAMLDELERVLTYERLQPRLAQLELTRLELMDFARHLSRVFEVPPGLPTVTQDRDDDIFLHCAMVAKAIFVVSGDHHLLDVGEYAGIQIVTVQEFLAQNPQF